ncbi:hypothetical protein [Streptomyces sp. NPDC005953]|uniref:hypothetical protein n=1 Tax=Streptomyces sp. NPDC005953 TaxID=3156719 RepID=UPI0033C7949A
MPAKTSVEVLTGDATEIRPLERRVDNVLQVETSLGSADEDSADHFFELLEIGLETPRTGKTGGI